MFVRLFEQLKVKCIVNNVLMVLVSPPRWKLSLQNKELQVAVKTEEVC